MANKKKQPSITKAAVRKPSTKKASPPFETEELRAELAKFLNQKVKDPLSGTEKRIGNYKYGVYAFYDYDDEPIYVGQTNEQLRTRIRRHLTNQRTDAVAMKVLDPFEVYKVKVWPLPQFEDISSAVSERLDAALVLSELERAVYDEAIAKSKFHAVLNEKAPGRKAHKVKMPKSFEGVIVSDEVKKLRGHPDTRLARRASTLASLAQIISERQVQGGRRMTLHTQARRLEWLAQQRVQAYAHRSEADDQDIDEGNV